MIFGTGPLADDARKSEMAWRFDRMALRSTRATVGRGKVSLFSLLVGACVAQGGQLRPMVGSRFGGTRQLGERNNRDVQLLRQSLEGSRDGRELHLPALEPPASLHQLNVIDDEQVQPVLRLQSPG